MTKLGRLKRRLEWTHLDADTYLIEGVFVHRIGIGRGWVVEGVSYNSLTEVFEEIAWRKDSC